VLAGDIVKEASDMNLPVVAVGLFYRKGYFHQDFDEAGLQKETYLDQDPADYPFDLVRGADGEELQIQVEIGDHEVNVRAWKLQVGKVKLYLLDTDVESNEIEIDRLITGYLYGGDQDTRIRQELILGVGGAKLLEKLEITPSIYHMNEGHSGFLVFEVARMYQARESLSFDDALERAKSQLVFTNHTLKAAGNDIFSRELFSKYLGPYMDNLQAPLDEIFAGGSGDQYSGEGFSMTILGMRHAHKVNAVSKLHGEVAAKLWPGFDIESITNGVHMPTWVSREFAEIFDQYLGPGWLYDLDSVDLDRILQIPYERVWKAHTDRKAKLIRALNSGLGLHLDPDALTIAWSRRLTAYKRPDLIVSDLERLERLVNIADRPVQILIAGKAHPRDTMGKEILQRIITDLGKCNKSVTERVIVIPGYNWQLARRMVSGSDVWLNTPYRFEEASGTSGMKAAANGVLQLTTKDGWTDEVDWQGKGWLIDEANPVLSLHDILEYNILPLYYDKSMGKYNEEWVSKMLNSMHLVLSQYSSRRMLQEYIDKLYLPLLQTH
jgi:starch phosphorylase